MKKIDTLISTVIGMLGLSFFALIVFVSILGENHRIDFLVQSFFSDLKDGNVASLCPLLKLENQNDACSDRLFLLELSLLSHFKLMEKSDYSLIITQDHFWLPLITSGRVEVGIALSEKKKNMFEEYMAKLENKDRIEGFMTVERRGGTWVITDIHLDSPALAAVMSDMEKTFDMTRYVSKSQHGYKLQPLDIDIQTLSHAERRLFEHSIKKISGGKPLND